MFIARESGFYSENCVDPENTDTPMSKKTVGNLGGGGGGGGGVIIISIIISLYAKPVGV